MRLGAYGSRAGRWGLALLVALALCGCGAQRAESVSPAPIIDTSAFTPLERAQVLPQNQAGYDRFYDDPARGPGCEQVV